MNWKISLSTPDISNDEINAVVDVLKSKWLTMGAITEKFEKMFSEMINVKYAFAVSNCTDALHLANASLGLKSGDNVICPALTFVATANASKYTGADVIFADSISADDLTVCPEDIEKKITPDTKAISVVHYGGFPCHMEKIMKIAQKYNLKVIEDCAHTPVCNITFNGKKTFLGTIGDVGCFSFFSNKNMTTGEGGMIVTNNDELASKIKLMRSHGMTTLTYDRHKGHASGYDVVCLGYNYRIDEIRSAIGVAQLKKLASYNKKRREVFKWYVDALKNNSNVIIPFKERNIEEAVPHIMPIIVKEKYNEIKQKLKDELIQTSKHYELIPNFTLYKNSNFESKINNISNILTLPMYPELCENDINFISRIINI